jgi:hypothetical protein
MVPIKHPNFSQLRLTHSCTGFGAIALSPPTDKNPYLTDLSMRKHFMHSPTTSSPQWLDVLMQSNLVDKLRASIQL